MKTDNELDKIKAGLVGKTIVKVEAQEWDHIARWLDDIASVRIHLSDGTVLDTLGEPLEVILPERR